MEFQSFLKDLERKISEILINKIITKGLENKTEDNDTKFLSDMKNNIDLKNNFIKFNDK